MPERYTLSNRKDDDAKPSPAKASSQQANGVLGLPAVPVYFWIILGVVIILITNVVTYFITANLYGKKLSDANAKSSELEQKLAEAENNPGSANSNSPGSTDIMIPQNTRNKLQAIMDSKKYQDLLNSLGENITVVVAGSSTTQQNRQQAIASLGFFNSATGQWNWNLSASQLQQLQQGSNAQYFGSNAIVGQTTDGYIVSLVVNESGQVVTILMSPTTQEASPTPETNNVRE